MREGCKSEDWREGGEKEKEERQRKKQLAQVLGEKGYKNSDQALPAAENPIFS